MTGHRLVQQTRDAKIRPFVIAANFPVREDLHQRIAQGRATTLVAIKFGTRSTDKRLVPISRLFLTSLGEQSFAVEAQSAEELRAEFRKALEAEGVPRALLDLTVEDELEEPSAKAHFCPGESRRAGLMFSDTPGVRPAPSRLPPWVGCGTVEGRPAPARLPPCPFAFAIIASGLLAS